MNAGFDVMACRRKFPGLLRRVAGRPAVFFDGPAGSQVPRSTISPAWGVSSIHEHRTAARHYRRRTWRSGNTNGRLHPA